MKNTLSEAARLYKIGFAIHWLHEKSKRPIDTGWGSGPRKKWLELKSQWAPNLNIGVRVGEPSKIGDKYLTVIDVDIKSTEKKHLKEANRAVKKLLNERVASCPRVDSGRGNGSRHYYCLSNARFKTWNPSQSTEIIKVHMPSKRPSKNELEKLTPAEIDKGIRLSHAWEISLYNDGRQVVLPPSVHPDSGKPYVWVRGVTDAQSLPVLDFKRPVEDSKATGALPGEGPGSGARERVELDGFIVEPVDLSLIEISEKIREGIINGKDVHDRSSFLLPATTALFSAGLSTNEILSVLTNPRFFISGCAYDHAKTRNRSRAARWLYRYTVKGVLDARSPQNIFAGVPIAPVRKLTLDARAKQDSDLQGDWRQDLERTGRYGEGPIKATLTNVILVLTKAIAPEIFKRDEFAFRDSYGCKTPWNAKRNAMISDDDISRIRSWLGSEFNFEPSSNTVHDAIVEIACRNSYDPVRDTLDALPDWDRKERLATWLEKHFEAEGDPEYLNQVFSKWMVAMVARVYMPGAKFDWMPIFEGAQGIGKSSFGRVLVGEKYFLDWLPNLGDKDAALGLQGMWAVEMGELASFRKNELEIIKAFITRTVDKFRPPHGRKLIESARRCVFFGTTNRDTYLRDDTGNRRFKPVKVGKLNFVQLANDRIQLFAEAKHKFKTEIKNIWDLELTGQARIYERQMHQEKMVEDDSDIMFELLHEYFEKARKNEVKFDIKKFKLNELFSGVLPPLLRWHLNTRNVMFAAKAVKKLGGEKRVIMGQKYWSVPQSSHHKGEGSTFDFDATLRDEIDF